MSKEREPSKEIKEGDEGKGRKGGNSRDREDYYGRGRDRARVIARGTFLTPDCKGRKIKIFSNLSILSFLSTATREERKRGEFVQGLSFGPSISRSWNLGWN